MIIAKIFEFFGVEKDAPGSIKNLMGKIIVIKIFNFIYSVILIFLSLRYFNLDKIFSMLLAFSFSLLFFIIKEVFSFNAKNTFTLPIKVFLIAINGLILSTGGIFLIVKEEIEEFIIFSYGIFDISDHTFSIKLEALNGVLGLSPTLIIVYICLFFIFVSMDFLPELMYSGEKHIKKDIQDLNFSNLSKQIEIFSSIQHELGNKLPATKQEIKFLLEIFEKKGATDQGLKISDKVREPLPGEELYSIDSVKDLFIRSLNKLDYSLNVVSQLGDVLKADPTKLKLEPLDLVEFLEMEVPKYSTSDNRVSIEIIGERNIFVDIDKTQFGFLLNNLISNAIRHGITEEFPELKIKFIVRLYGKFIHLIVINNGYPMDSSITFEKFTTPFFHFGRTGSSGLGGYIINTIIKNHNASFTLNSTIIGSDTFKTVFDFKFKGSNKK